MWPDKSAFVEEGEKGWKYDEKTCIFFKNIHN